MFAPGRVLDADLELLHGQRKKEAEVQSSIRNPLPESEYIVDIKVLTDSF